MTRPYLQHARRHLPTGSDPLPFLLKAPTIVPPFVVFDKTSLTPQVAANTPTTWDWTGATIETNDIDGTLDLSPGDTWTGVHYSVNFGSDANTVNITAGVYLIWAHYWVNSLDVAAPFWINVYMDGTSFGFISPPGEHQTTYVNPDSAFDNGNTYGHLFHPLIENASMTRKLVITHDCGGTVSFDQATLALVRLGDLS